MIVGGPLSVAAGLLLATAVFVVIASLGGSRDGGFCSPFGNIGRYETSAPGKIVGYLDEGWGGFPPVQSCSVFLLDDHYGNPSTPVEEILRREPPPHHLLAHGSYPGSRARLWIVVLLLLPPAIWCLFVIGSALKSRRTRAALKKRASVE